MQKVEIMEAEWGSVDWSNGVETSDIRIFILVSTFRH